MEKGGSCAGSCLIEDHRKPLVRAAFWQEALEEEGFAVDVAYDGEEGDFKARSATYDVIILDLMLPKIDGFDIANNPARRSGLNTHVLVLTARDALDDKVKGLDLGADDYFDQAVPTRRTAGAIARSFAADIRSRIRCCAFVTWISCIDTAGRCCPHARLPGQAIHLTPQVEYALLQFLAFHRGKVVSRSMIWEHLYDEHDENTSNVVDVYIRYLRAKIDKGFEPPLIQTRWGEGYLLRGDDPS